MDNFEILKKYGKVISDDLEKYYKLYNITTKHEKILFEERYKTCFIKGFHKGSEHGQPKGEATGVQKRSAEIASNMLAQDLDIQFISKMTGLPQDEIIKLRKE